MVVGQRLARKICPHCAASEPIGPEETELFIRNDLEPPAEVPKAVGCESCDNTGYNGRSGIIEVLEVDRAMEELISAGAIHSKIEETASKSGTCLMFKQALKKVARKTTSIEEVQRVIAYA
jgi:type II secretory ATPase GspE/PulE/Tfp pilus assembly ATPase PilB-like protein